MNADTSLAERRNPWNVSQPTNRPPIPVHTVPEDFDSVSCSYFESLQCCEKVSIPHQEIVVFHYYSNKTNLLEMKVIWTCRGHQALIVRMKTKTNYKAITLEWVEKLNFSCEKVSIPLTILKC